MSTPTITNVVAGSLGSTPAIRRACSTCLKNIRYGLPCLASLYLNLLLFADKETRCLLPAYTLLSDDSLLRYFGITYL